MFGDCFGTKIPDSGQILPAGCFLGFGAGFAFAGAVFFAARRLAAPASRPASWRRRPSWPPPSSRAPASSPAWRTSSAGAFAVAFFAAFFAGRLLRRLRRGSLGALRRAAAFAGVFAARSASRLSPGCLDSLGGRLLRRRRLASGAFFAAARAPFVRSWTCRWPWPSVVPFDRCAAPDGESGECYAPGGRQGNGRTLGQRPGPRSGFPGLACACGDRPLAGRWRSSAPSTPSIRTRLVRDDRPADQRHRRVLDAERPGQQRAGRVVRPAVGRRRGHPELQRGAVPAHDRGPAGTRAGRAHPRSRSRRARRRDRRHRTPPFIVRPVPFGPVDPHLDLVELENRVLAGWQDDDVFAESLRRREGAPEWVFYEGPPTANGRPGIHHVWARLFKDIYPRFHTMRGKYVPRKAGWDCHGLPGRGRGREGARVLGQARDRGLRHRGVQPALPRVGAALRRGLVGADEPHRHVARHVRRLLDDEQRVHRERLVAVPPDVGQGAALRGLQGRPLLRSVRHRALESRARPARRVPRRHRGLGVRPLPGRRARLRPARVDDHAVDARVERRRRGRSRHRVRPRPRTPSRRPRPRAWRRARVPAVLGDDAEIVGPVAGRRPRRAAGTSGRSTGCPPTGDGWRVVAADFVTTDDGSGIVHLAPAFGEIDREVARGRGSPDAQPGERRRPASTDAVPGLRRDGS